MEEPAFDLFARAQIMCPVFRMTISSGLIGSLARESPGLIANHLMVEVRKEGDDLLYRQKMLSSVTVGAGTELKSDQ